MSIMSFEPQMPSGRCGNSSRLALFARFAQRPQVEFVRKIAKQSRSCRPVQMRKALILPKQIIYSMRYIRPWLNPDATSDERFCAAISAFLGGTHVVPIGRARSGLYLLVKN